MHKISRYQKRLGRRDQKSHPYVQRVIAKRNVGSRDSNQCAEQERVKYKEIPPNMVAEMIVVMFIAHKSKQI
jgi:hypothetical protein